MLREFQGKECLDPLGFCAIQIEATGRGETTVAREVSDTWMIGISCDGDGDGVDGDGSSTRESEDIDIVFFMKKKSMKESRNQPSI